MELLLRSLRQLAPELEGSILHVRTLYWLRESYKILGVRKLPADITEQLASIDVDLVFGQPDGPFSLGGTALVPQSRDEAGRRYELLEEMAGGGHEETVRTAFIWSNMLLEENEVDAALKLAKEAAGQSLDRYSSISDLRVIESQYLLARTFVRLDQAEQAMLLYEGMADELTSTKSSWAPPAIEWWYDSRVNVAPENLAAVESAINKTLGYWTYLRDVRGDARTIELIPKLETLVVAMIDVEGNEPHVDYLRRVFSGEEPLERPLFIKLVPKGGSD